MRPSRLHRLQCFPVPRNPLSTLAVSAPPSSSSRQLIPPSPPRHSGETPKHQSHGQQLALTQPTPGLQPPLLACSPGIPLAPPHATPSLPSASSIAAYAVAAATAPRSSKRQRLKYHLDVGAYGIPKHRHPSRSSSSLPHTSLSVQVGEDAYFLRDNAMGIADGVGGWSRSARSGPCPIPSPSPSALFSRRLMHFCSSEIDALMSAPVDDTSGHDHNVSELEESLHTSLEELSDGIDVLRILEHAYDSTVKAHLAPPNPLTTGSSTALLAILDHSLPTHTPQFPEPPHKNYAAGSINLPLPEPPSDPDSKSSASHSPTLSPSDLSSSDSPAHAAYHNSTPDNAVLHIAHLGDCMGMLIRGDSIVWRSDEMWWGYNHPLQLGPPSLSSLSNPPIHKLPVQPHTFTLPILADDILILASDGLSDNLWDEDVLDEVLKFKRREGWGLGPSSSSSPSTSTSSPSFKSTPTLLRRKAFSGMLSEALCSRAKHISERRTPLASTSDSCSTPSRTRARSVSSLSTSKIKFQPSISVVSEDCSSPISLVTSNSLEDRAHLISKSSHGQVEQHTAINSDETPFSQRARVEGRTFKGGKCDGPFSSLSCKTNNFLTCFSF